MLTCALKNYAGAFNRPVATMKHGSTLVSETAQFTALVYLDSRWVVAATSSGTLLVYDTAPGHWQHTCVGTLEGK